MPFYQSKRLRLGRWSEVGRPYLITTSTFARAPLFAEWELGCLVARTLQAEHNTGRVNNIAWVIMPDHIHWLFELNEGNLSAVICRAKARSAMAVNGRLGRSGPIWQKGFHDRAIRRTDNFKAAARYIISNPIRAGLVPSIGQYPFWDAMWLSG